MREVAAAAASPETAPRPLRVLLLAALLREVRPFLRQVQGRAADDLGLAAWAFPLRTGTAAVVLTGMGPEAAARAGARLLDRCRPETLISVGFGGALTPDLPPAAVVLGESFWQYAPETGELKAVVAPPPPRPLPELWRRLRESGLPAFTGSLVTTSFILHKASQGQPLRGLPHPVLDLETAPLAAAAAARGLAFLALRGITDGAADEIPDFLRQDLQAGAEPRLATVLAAVARAPRRLLPLLGLWRASRAAASSLARALQVLLPSL